MQMDDSSSSDDDGLPDLMQSDPDELSRIRARNFMQHMLLTTAFFGLVRTAALVGNMPREVWKIDRCSDQPRGETVRAALKVFVRDCGHY